MSCPNIIEIQRTQCIGNSLEYINENFTNLKNSICDNDSIIQTVNSDLINLNTTVDELSSTITPGAAKAWCKFSGIRDKDNVISTFLTDRLIYDNFNISSVYRKNTGDYRIYFGNNFASNRYALVGTSSEKLNIGTGKYTWVQPYRLTSAYAEIKVQSSVANSLVDPDFVSLVFY